MAKQRAPIEFNSLSGGIITEASALTFPDGASIDEENFDFAVNNARNRRFGIEFESGAVYHDTGFTYLSERPAVMSSFLWSSVAGNSEVSIVVLQLDNKVMFYTTANDSLSSGILLYTYTGPIPYTDITYGFANVSGTLVMTTGSSDIIIVNATITLGVVTLTQSESRITIRDLFGVPVTYNRGVESAYTSPDLIDLSDPAYATKRPQAFGLSQVHTYNLRNQTFAVRRLTKTSSSVTDPIASFLSTAGKYPSMSDTIIAALYNNLDATNKTADRFHAEDLRDNPPGAFQAPKGYFIIDALDRSISREERWAELAVDQSYSEGVSLPDDITPGGATAIAGYGGRAWYGGFSEAGSVTGEGGLRLEGYLMYSQLSSSGDVLTRCYQAGDPTSVDFPELLDTDGGFLSLDGAYGITKLVPLGNSLIVFCDNGVWAVSGSDGNYFTPTTPRVQKITDRGSISAEAVVVIDSSVMFWANDGIHLITVNQVGDYEINNLTENTIQTLFDEIPYVDKARVVGSYDSYTAQVVWAVHNTIYDEEDMMLLKLLVPTGAFTKYRVAKEDNRVVLGPVSTPPFTLEAVDDLVVVGVDNIVVGADDVIVEAIAITTSITTIKYAVLQDIAGYSNVSFATFSDASHLDWDMTDASAFIVTGYVSGGDFQRGKQTPYVTMHFNRTEDGFIIDEVGDLSPLHPSSCFVQAQWDWANSAISGKWSRTFQAYKYPRMYSPSGIEDVYDSGFSTINTKNKIRGGGRVLSLKFTTEAGKDCSIIGWSAIMEVNENV